MRIGVSGAHGTGKSTLVDGLCEHLPGHLPVAEPYWVLEEEGFEFTFPPTVDDYRLQLRRSIESLRVSTPNLVFDRTPLDFLAYLDVSGHALNEETTEDELAPVFSRLDALLLLPVTDEVRRSMPQPEMPQLREAMNTALLDLAYDDPFNAWKHVPILELDGTPAGRLEKALHLLRNLAADHQAG